jgi:hypothetical protein
MCLLLLLGASLPAWSHPAGYVAGNVSDQGIGRRLRAGSDGGGVCEPWRFVGYHSSDLERDWQQELLDQRDTVCAALHRHSSKVQEWLSYAEGVVIGTRTCTCVAVFYLSTHHFQIPFCSAPLPWPLVSPQSTPAFASTAA